MIKFQYYPDRVDTNQPIGYITLDQFIRATKEPKEHLKEVFANIKQASINGDKAKKSELKQNHLHYFTPCVHLKGGRGYKNIVQYTGLLTLDFDGLDSFEYATEFKHFLFNEYDSIITTWLSSSGLGVRAFVNIPIVETPEQFKQYFFGIASEVDQYNGFDIAPQNSVLPLFQSYDPDMLIRDNYTTWTTIGYKKNNFDTTPNFELPDINVTKDETDRVIKMIHKGMDNIWDNGHPQLRALSVAVGGYVGAGYIDKSNAVDLLSYLITNHRYLSKGVHGYIKTACWGIEKGMTKPLILK